ncbi:uncharacterized protein NFIA_013820 [Aspergillus fischeri NRRL 181]|uniref:ADP-ribosylation factor n=1 Tax=Neosartorya fischeri (strain ATCC 1020 / DSM 3700 / CBS 544.65 / FGSC A1164 / JCM 1740 / NRRL 181 / WB 181) TaxID=331117 RepID=A1D2P9_NEOFI|nr:conserved hypothetical protein [Aspergillus fischeri NRRL 181]EAW22692.1 conserved hypothetical protein [Aspergillus fischeri NRRL 181]
MSSSSASSDQSPYEYYASFTDRPTLQGKFRDIDEESCFYAYNKRLRDAQTQNFVLDFGNDDAWCAMNLRQEDFGLLLRKPILILTTSGRSNIWAPEEQKDVIKEITSYYGVSERLQGMMCTDPVAARPEAPAPVQSLRASFHRSIDRSHRPRMEDLEEAVSLKNLSDPDDIQKAASFRGLTFAHVTNQIWHFCSVDHGPRYTCVGYNSLYVIPNVGISNGRDLPNGKRLWSWLILCDDGTVISIQENPYPRISEPRPESEVKSVLGVVRRNVQIIFSGASKQHSASSESDSLVTIRVRASNDSRSDHVSIHQDDGPGLLFYYIFDDWVTSYALIAKREHKYGILLDRLRGDMLNKPVVDLVNELHWLGRRLAVLRRLYQSYELILTRVLQRQRLLRDEARSRHPRMPPGHIIQSESELSSNCENSVGVRLNSAAIARFERLLDRIKLYCLTEIDACLTEKESLTFLNFNLIALKDSQAVEKLTRITILLAKITILFLPVSLMTAYFSTELRGVKGVYTQTEYWISFAVIMVLSLLVLVLFGYASGTIEGRPIYQSLSRTFISSSKDKLGHQRKHVD